MKALLQFTSQPPNFWAYVRSISEAIGYTNRLDNTVKAANLGECINVLKRSGRSYSELAINNTATSFGKTLVKYFTYRAKVSNEYIEPRLMTVDRARDTFNELQVRLGSQLPIPMNKQTGAKKAPAYFTAIVNMLIESKVNEYPCDFNPKRLTSFVKNKRLLGTFSRRFDGAFPSTVNPIAIWEIKEYYYTTTFGSRIANAVHETLLDGFEIKELGERENIRVGHYVMIDAYPTWWKQGKSYLCRMIDLLNMGLVDEVLFGYEVVERLPEIVSGWAAKVKKLNLMT